MIQSTLYRVAAIAALASISFSLTPAIADDKPADAQAYEQAVQKAIDFLHKNQAADGSFTAATGPAVTALVTTAVLESGRTADDPVVAKALKFLEGFIQPDGGIYQPKSQHRNYETCIAIQCLAAANRDGRYDKQLKAADHFVKGLQWDEGEQRSIDDPNYGGAGYGRSERPDLSNTSFLIDALKAAGNSPQDEAMQRALIFVSRCQNLETPHNTTKFAAKNPDGGFYYTPAAGGTSQAGTTPEGGLRSYGSMTYAGLKSMIFAGVNSDDPRVKAAFNWIQQHYSVDENPGLADAGLYYYYNTFGKALEAMKIDQFIDSKGNKHDWRAELRDAVIKRQQVDGSWLNKNARWMEGDPNLVTGYALLTLSHCKPAKK